jgi:poly(A) polymerase
MRFAHVPQMKDSTFKRFVRMPHFEQHLELHRLDCQASHHDLTSWQFTRERMTAIPPEAIRPEPLVTGDDLIAAGYEPGPRFKEILGSVEDAQLEGRLDSKASAMQYVRREFPQPAAKSARN